MSFSRMAANATAPPTEHLRIMALCEDALDFARRVEPGGAFLCKVLRRGTSMRCLPK